MPHRRGIARSVYIVLVVWGVILPVLGGWPVITLANAPLPFSENFDTFTGAGFDSNPAVGQLDSDVWIVTGFSDGSMVFGDSQTTLDFARGPSVGGVGTGGVYAFDVGGGNIILGIQPIGADFTPGEIILRLQNNTGSAITQLDVSYDIWFLNDQGRDNSLNFSYSPDDVAYTPVVALDFSTPQVADGLGWQSAPRSTTLTGLNIPDGSSFYLKWSGDDVGGAGNRDEYGLDNVQVTIPAGDPAPVVASTTPANGATNMAINTNININFSETVTVTTPWFTINCTNTGPHTATVSGGSQNYTLNPDTDFANNETCTITITAAQVADQDGTPDTMAADYVFNFTTIPAPGAWIINEIHADPDAVNGDANGDGVAHTTQDEFVEIINNSGGTADISGWSLSDGVGVRHTFSVGTLLNDQCAVIVFAGGSPTGTFGGAVVQTASNGQLGLNNGGDTLTLNDGATDQATYTYGTEGGNSQSLTRDPDIGGIDPLVLHSLATGSGGVLFSPGNRVDGTPFALCGPPDVSPNVTTTIPINAATNIAIDANISLSFSEDVTVTNPWVTINCTNSGLHSATVSGGLQNYTLNPDANFSNAESCTVMVLATQVADQDGTPDTMAADYVFNFTTIPAPGAWLINEIHADPDAVNGDANGDGVAHTTQDEFIEIINNTGGVADISGWTVSDSLGVHHVFPAGTFVPDQCPVLLFSGGAPTGLFGGAIIQTATTGQLDLNNGGDTVRLNNGVTDQAIYTYGGEGGDNQSLTRDPDINGAEPLVRHSLATGSGGTLFSPGTRLNGAAFGTCGPPDFPPTVTATNPINGATNVPVTTTLAIQFNEIVAITGSAFSLNCGSPIGFNVTPLPPGNADTFTLTPTADLPDGATCTVTISAPQVTDQDGTPDNMAANYAFTFDTAAPPALILIGEFLYDGTTPSTEGDEFVELCNPNPGPVDLTGYKVGDEETAGGGEGMYHLPAGTLLAPGACLALAKSAADFQARFGVSPDLEISALSKYTTWGSGSWSLANTGDELLLLGPGDEILDSVAYRNGDYATLGLEPDASAPEPHSLQRVWPVDTNSMPYDFVRLDPSPGSLIAPSPPLAVSPATLPDGMFAYWGHLHAHTTYSDGSGPPHYALALARAAGMHYYGITDHGWWLTEAEWVSTLTQTISATVPGQFVALRGVEWTHATSGHINVFNSDTLLQRTNPLYDTLPELYDWLAVNPNAIAQFNHPDPNFDGTFDDFAYYPLAAPGVYLQEVGNAAQSYTTYEAPFVQANAIGWRVAPTINSDTHNARWGSDLIPRTGIVAPNLTEADLLAAMRARRVFATEDSNLALVLRTNGQWMGSVLTATGTLSLTIDVVDPDPEAITLQLYDSNLLLATVPLPGSTGQWSTIVNALPGHFFWVKAVQADGDIAYTAPIWIEGVAPVDALVINEIMPAPFGVDWDGNGQANGDDEWIELYNPLDRPIGLGGWRLRDSAGVTYNIPLEVSIPAGGYLVLYKAQTGIALNNNGDTLSLTHPNGAIINIVSYDHSPGSDDSWCRIPDGGPTWSDNCIPSPAVPNQARLFDPLPDSEPLHVKIFDAKRLTLGAWVVVTGRVTAPPGVLGSRVMYIQDSTAGIKIYLPRDHRLHLNVGDVVEVEGNLDSFHEEFEIEVDERGDVKTKEAGPPLPPLPIATTSLLEPYEGMLVMLQGQAVHFRGRTTLWLDDGTGWAKVFISSSTGIRKPFIEPGVPLTAVGIVGQYSDSANPSREDYRLLPRFQTDLILPGAAPSVPAGWPIFLPETGN